MKKMALILTTVLMMTTGSVFAKSHNEERKIHELSAVIISENCAISGKQCDLTEAELVYFNKESMQRDLLFGMWAAYTLYASNAQSNGLSDSEYLRIEKLIANLSELFDLTALTPCNLPSGQESCPLR